MKKKNILILFLFIIISIILNIKLPRIAYASQAFTSKYFEDDVINYYLYTPTNINDNQKTPLIVWLHGWGEFGCSAETFKNRGLLKVLNEWSLEPFNAYVVCPHHIEYYDKEWNNDSDRINTLIKNIISKYNIDTNNIILVGHSWGGKGALNIAYDLPNRFSKLAVLSGYDPGVDISKIKIPTKGYVEKNNSPELVEFMNNKFKNTFGEDNLIQLDCGHTAVPEYAFCQDNDKDGKSDLTEWAFGGYSSNTNNISGTGNAWGQRS